MELDYLWKPFETENKARNKGIIRIMGPGKTPRVRINTFLGIRQIFDSFGKHVTKKSGVSHL